MTKTDNRENVVKQLRDSILVEKLHRQRLEEEYEIECQRMKKVIQDNEERAVSDKMIFTDQMKQLVAKKEELRLEIETRQKEIDTMKTRDWKQFELELEMESATNQCILSTKGPEPVSVHSALVEENKSLRKERDRLRDRVAQLEVQISNWEKKQKDAIREKKIRMKETKEVRTTLERHVSERQAYLDSLLQEQRKQDISRVFHLNTD